MYTGLSSANDSDYLTTNYEYDAWGRLVRTTDSTGYNSGTITYDLNGNVLTTTDANGNVTTNTYDALNRVLTTNTVCEDTSKNVSKSYTYNNMGRVTKKVSNGVETSYEYDALGRIYREWGPNFKGYFYEGISNYVEEQLVGKAHLLFYSVTNYEYDGEMRVVKVKESGNETVSYTYDANGNKASETLANGVVSTYTYNGCNKITNLVTKSGNFTISSYEYSYYLDGSDACKVRSESGIIETTDYEYDGLKRLTEEAVTTGNSTDTYAYEYDDYGNRLQMTATGSEEYTTVYDYNDANGNYTALLQEETKTVEDDSNAATENGLASSPLDLVNAASEDTGVETTAYTYDANGNQITKATDEKTETNTYDGLNQLIGFTDGETVASYTYDVDGLRLSKTVDGVTTKHVWDGNKQIVADVVNSQYYEADCYLRGTNLVATYHYQNGVKSGYTYYTQNAHGDVVNLTDADGAITKSYTYDAFGVEKNINDADTNAFRYCGEYYDAETGTVYLRARYYNPSIGRFISRDSYAGRKFDPLSLNLYTYCGNNPVLFTDPFGHDYYYFYGEDQKDAFESNKNQLEELGETVHPFYIQSEEDFTNNWNDSNMNTSDSVIINLHGNAYNVNFMNINSLKKQEIGYLYLFSCNTGHKDNENNPAMQLFEHSSINALVACDGKHFRQPLSNSKVMHSVLTSNSFRKFREELNPGSYRTSTGFNVYTRLHGDIKETNIGRIFFSLNSIIKETQKVAKSTEIENMFSKKSTGNKYLDKWTDGDGNLQKWS